MLQFKLLSRVGMKLLMHAWILFSRLWRKTTKTTTETSVWFWQTTQRSSRCRFSRMLCHWKPLKDCSNMPGASFFMNPRHLGVGNLKEHLLCSERTDESLQKHKNKGGGTSSWCNDTHTPVWLQHQKNNVYSSICSVDGTLVKNKALFHNWESFSATNGKWTVRWTTVSRLLHLCLSFMA